MRRLLLLAFLLLLSFPAGAAAHPAPAFVAVPNLLPRALRDGTARPLAPLPPSTPLHLAFSLASRNPLLEDRLLAAIYDPRSPLYHRFLDADAYRRFFGPDPAAVHALIQWLAEHRLRSRPWNGGTLLDVDGNAGHVAAAFQTGLWRYRIPTPRAHASAPAGGTHAALEVHGFALRSDPLVPAPFAPLVRGIVGLSSAGQAAAMARTSRAQSLHPAALPIGYSVSDVTAAYDFGPIYAAGFHGERTRVALVELAPYNPADIAAYRHRYGSAPAPTNFTERTGNTSADPNIEATMDIEMLGSIAPGAAIDVYNAPNEDTGAGLLDAYSGVASAANADVLALTWNFCEPVAQQLPGFVDAMHVLFKQIVLEGTTIVAASGDAGAYACGDSSSPSTSTSALAVNVPASDPLALAVAASDLTLATSGSGKKIAGETAWSCRLLCAGNGARGSGSGGGLSRIFHRGGAHGDDLSWQAGPGVLNRYSNGYRQLPDVAASGSDGAGNAHEYLVYWEGAWVLGSGTSAATPIWAGLVLLANQYLASLGRARLGWIDPRIYRLASLPQSYSPFHDITGGDNLYYPATLGWDYASGWGSPDAWNIVRDLAVDASGGGATPSPIASPAFTSTATQHPLATATSTPPATPLPSSTATLTPTPSVASLCARSGIANGTFATGTLACWQSRGAPLPRVILGAHARLRYSARLGGALGQRQSSAISQSFSVPSSMKRPYLHLDYRVLPLVSTVLVGKSSCRRACMHAPLSAQPRLTITGGATPLHWFLLPRRFVAWTGFRAPLPLCTASRACAHRHFVLTLTVPPQPAGAGESLEVDAIYLGA